MQVVKTRSCPFCGLDGVVRKDPVSCDSAAASAAQSSITRNILPLFIMYCSLYQYQRRLNCCLSNFASKVRLSRRTPIFPCAGRVSIESALPFCKGGCSQFPLPQGKCCGEGAKHLLWEKVSGSVPSGISKADLGKDPSLKLRSAAANQCKLF